jgi:formate/nitrite transporter FocA (FNT family)
MVRAAAAWVFIYDDVSFTTAIKETVATACKLAKQAIKFWCCNIIGSKITAWLNASQEMSSMGMYVIQRERERERGSSNITTADPPKLR